MAHVHNPTSKEYFADIYINNESKNAFKGLIWLFAVKCIKRRFFVSFPVIVVWCLPLLALNPSMSPQIGITIRTIMMHIHAFVDAARNETTSKPTAK